MKRSDRGRKNQPAYIYLIDEPKSISIKKRKKPEAPVSEIPAFGQCYGWNDFFIFTSKPLKFV